MKAEADIKTKTPELVKAENRVPRWVLPSVKVSIVLVDAFLAFACFAFAFIVRQGQDVFSQTAWAWSKDFVPYAGVVFFAIPVRVAALWYQRVYRLQGAFSYIAEFIKIFKAVSIASLLMIAFTFLFRGGFAFRDFSYARGVFALDYVFALVVYTIFHLGLRYAQALVRRRDVNLIPTLVVGTNAEAANTIKELKQRRDLGYRVMGVIATENTEEDREIFESLLENDLSSKTSASSAADKNYESSIIGEFEELPEIIRLLDIQEVIITDNKIPSEKLFDAMMQLGRSRQVEFRLAPSLFNFLPQKTSVEQIGVLPMVRLFREPLSDGERFVKRFFDIAFSTLVLVLTAPLWILISILIKLDSKGPVLFRQERVGMDGRKFLCYKFRTMHAGADETIHREAYRKNIEGAREANAGDEENPVFGKVKDDPRITRVGRFLRRTSLDEMPQFLNVLRGEMSVVGARPPIPYEVEEYDLRHRKRLDMKPGITGLWQVSGRNRLTFEEMVRIDLYYIENWSLWLDLKIILLTFPAVLRGDGAR